MLESFKDLEGLPSLPGQIMNMLEESSRTSTMDYNVIQLIQYDPAIALRVLKKANSPLYGFSGKIASVQQALGLLGPAAIKNIILTTPILERFRDFNSIDLDIDFPRLWRYMGITSAIAGGLARIRGNMETDVCFTAGLTHDAGKIALAVQYPALFQKALNLCSEKSIPLALAEGEVFGFTHTDVLVVLAKKWKFPHQLIHAVSACCLTRMEEVVYELPSVICLAKHLADSWGYADGIDTHTPMNIGKVLEVLNISEGELKSWEPQLREQLDAALSVIGE